MWLSSPGILVSGLMIFLDCFVSRARTFLPRMSYPGKAHRTRDTNTDTGTGCTGRPLSDRSRRMSERIVIIGGGVAAARTVRAYRDAGGGARLVVVSAETRSRTTARPSRRACSEARSTPRRSSSSRPRPMRSSTSSSPRLSGLRGRHHGRDGSCSPTATPRATTGWSWRGPGGLTARHVRRPLRSRRSKRHRLESGSGSRSKPSGRRCWRSWPSSGPIPASRW